MEAIADGASVVLFAGRIDQKLEGAGAPALLFTAAKVKLVHAFAGSVKLAVGAVQALTTIICDAVTVPLPLLAVKSTV